MIGKVDQGLGAGAGTCEGLVGLGQLLRHRLGLHLILILLLLELVLSGGEREKRQHALAYVCMGGATHLQEKIDFVVLCERLLLIT
jgi:hypothetical protein